MSRPVKKRALRGLLALAFLAAGVGLALPARAFHSGGVASCDGCHSMHRSSGDDGTQPSQTSSYLLTGSDPGSTCLYCHNVASPYPVAYMVSTDGSVVSSPGSPPTQMTPGGDFAWLRKTFRWASPVDGSIRTSTGDQHGHNIVALDYGYLPDSVRSLAPGGQYPSSSLSCTSCHDPHGRYRRLADGSIAQGGAPIAGSGSYSTSRAPTAGVASVGAYRLLGGAGYQPRSVSGNLAFAANPPAAVSPPDYNRGEAVTQTRVAYGSGFSEWCANCHASILVGGETSGMGSLEHPAGATARLDAGIVTNYNAYVMTGNVTNADPSRAYWSLVPFEEGTATYSVLQAHARTDDSYLAGPDTNSNVSCLTCHRAHASGFDAITRFRTTNEFLTVGVGGISTWPDPASNPAQAEGRTASETQASYYDRPATSFAPFQARLCNKCHVND